MGEPLPGQGRGAWGSRLSSAASSPGSCQLGAGLGTSSLWPLLRWPFEAHRTVPRTDSQMQRECPVSLQLVYG